MFITFGSPATPFDDEINVGENDEWGRKGGFLLVVHDDVEAVKLPNLMREDVRLEKNGIEDGNQQVE